MSNLPMTADNKYSPLKFLWMSAWFAKHFGQEADSVVVRQCGTTLCDVGNSSEPSLGLGAHCTGQSLGSDASILLLLTMAQNI